MGIQGIIFMLIALCGVVINFFPQKLLRKKNTDDTSLLKIKLTGLVLVVSGISLLMIFGK